MQTKRKLVVVGDGACGKTCLLTTYTSNEFPEIHVPTIYDVSTKELISDDFTLTLTMYDTAGEEDYDRLRPLVYPKTNIVLICFAVDRPWSLSNVKRKWSKEIKHFLPGIPVILVATKLDLRNDPEVIKLLKKSNEHPVTVEEGEKVARKINAVKYVECSAKTMVNVKKVFEEAAFLAMTYKPSFVFSRQCLLF